MTQARKLKKNGILGFFVSSYFLMSSSAELILKSRYLNQIKPSNKFNWKSLQMNLEPSNKIHILEGHMIIEAIVKIKLNPFRILFLKYHMKTVIYDDIILTTQGSLPSFQRFLSDIIAWKKHDFEKVETKYARQSGKGTQDMAEFHLELTVSKGQTSRNVCLMHYKPKRKKLAFIVAGLMRLFLLQDSSSSILAVGQDTLTKFKYQDTRLIIRTNDPYQNEIKQAILNI